MNHITLFLYIQFLFRTNNRCTATELSRVIPGRISHDTVTRWLKEKPAAPSDLWRRASKQVKLNKGYLIGDDSVLEHPYGKHISLVRMHWSGSEGIRTIGIPLVALVWTDGVRRIIVDYRIYTGDKSKHELFQGMLKSAYKRGFRNQEVLFDAWYAKKETMKLIRSYGWHWTTVLKKNRKVRMSLGSYVSISDLDWSAGPAPQVWLKDYGWVRVTQAAPQKTGSVRYLASSHTRASQHRIRRHYAMRWTIEEVFRILKQVFHIHGCQARDERSQRMHIHACLSGFNELEPVRLQQEVSFYELQAELSRSATALQLTAFA